MDNVTLKVKRLTDSVSIPKYAHDGDMCFDISVYVDDNEFAPKALDGQLQFKFDSDTVIEPQQTVLFHTGLKFETPKGYGMKVHVRSSIGIKKHLILSNATGIIDTAQYRGELMVALTNISSRRQKIESGERVAQAEIVKVLDVDIKEVDELSDTERGTGGIGSTGTK